jgi:hypothetical protein
MLAVLVLGAVALASLSVIASGDRFDAQPAAPRSLSVQAAPTEAPRSPLVSKPERKPFAKLFQFEPRTVEQPKLLDPVGGTRTPPRVVCGMVILDAKRDIDPRAIIPPPPGSFAIRRIEPSVCRNQ